MIRRLPSTLVVPNTLVTIHGANYAGFERETLGEQFCGDPGVPSQTHNPNKSVSCDENILWCNRRKQNRDCSVNEFVEKRTCPPALQSVSDRRSLGVDVIRL
jgi:hypothetical protein